ncbi:hypothetical protein [Bacterioplanoides sp.]|uniref:hypothetical protein n=1 Tax=Bacterioplanoides sp. TaxID=2066072 RepID=UPI003B00290D
MKLYGFSLILLFSALILGCNDQQAAEEKKAIEEPAPVSFEGLPNGTYRISLKQTNTRTISYYPPKPAYGKKPIIVESYSEWLLHHQDDAYHFELTDLRYSYDIALLSIVFDTRWDEVITESKIQGYYVENKNENFPPALEKLKTIKGFSFSLGKTSDSTETLLNLTSSYQIPLESLTIPDNKFSPHDEIKIHLSEKNIVPIFSMMMAHPAKPLTANETYTSTTGTWELSNRADKLTYNTNKDNASLLVKNHFDHNNILRVSYYSRTHKKPVRTIKYRETEIDVFHNYNHKAKVEIRAADDAIDLGTMVIPDQNNP